MDIYTITAGIGSDGTRYLQLFLQEYTKLFKEKVNPACPKCLNEYLTRYKNYYKEMANTCKYRLHAKYENIPLEFGSPILVNNANITEDYAKKLLEQAHGLRYFSKLPDAIKARPAGEKMKRKRIQKIQPDAPIEPQGNTDIFTNDDAE